MRNRPTGRNDERPVPSLAVTGAKSFSIASCTLLPHTIPAAPTPSMPRNTRRPTGDPSTVTTVRHRPRYRAAAAIRSSEFSSELSADRELLAVHPLRRDVDHDLLGRVVERAARLAVRIGDSDGPALVAAFAQRGDERDATDDRHAERRAQRVATTASEDLVALAVVAGEPAHVLDDAADGQVDLAGHERAALRDPLRRRLR